MKSSKNLLIILAVFALAILPLLTVQRPEPGPGAEGGEIFAGADSQAEEMITQVNPSYKPWFEPLMEPPSGEIESLLFALQAALGAGFLGYFFGAARTRAELGGGSKDAKC